MEQGDYEKIAGDNYSQAWKGGQPFIQNMVILTALTKQLKSCIDTTMQKKTCAIPQIFFAFFYFGV